MSDRRWVSFVGQDLTWSPRRDGVPVPWAGPGFEALLLTRSAFAPGHFAEVTGERTIAFDGREFTLAADVNGVALSQDGRLWVGTEQVGVYSATGQLQGKATDVGLCFNLWTVAPDGSQLASAPFPAVLDPRAGDLRATTP